MKKKNDFYTWLDQIAEIKAGEWTKIPMKPLTTDEVFDYISAHMRYSKAPDSIFTTESINLIAAHSKGIPRVINTICKHSLIYAASKNETLINDEIVQAVIDNELPPCAIC